MATDLSPAPARRRGACTAAAVAAAVLAAGIASVAAAQTAAPTGSAAPAAPAASAQQPAPSPAQAPAQAPAQSPAAAAPPTAGGAPGASPAPASGDAPAAPTASPALTPEQQQAADCRFLEGSFSRLNAQLNERAVNPGPQDLQLINVMADLQRNLILIHQSRQCDAGRLVQIIREEVPPPRPTASAAPPQRPVAAAPEAAATAGPGTMTAAAAPRPQAPPAQKSAAPASKGGGEAIEPVSERFLAKGNVNVRARPAPTAERLGAFKAGGPVPVVGRIKGTKWYKVDIGGGNAGYVYGDGLISQSAQASAQGAQAAKAAQGASPEAVVAEIKKRADAGDPDAQFRMGNYFVERDMFEAVGWWQSAAEKGHSAAQYNLGVAYLRGGSVPMDRGKAIEWFRKAAAQGHQNAKKALSDLGAS
ncbi:MAG: SEL1-like repeat protein [Alphaproteobacteria bacterium]|nr:SEL1-like repeat protein [Alphaproteobacteria bacterium]